MLSAKAQQTIQNYLSLPFPGLANVRCPYFNNAKLQQRGQLRVLIGKGTPQEIVEEAQIVSIQYRAGLFDKTGSCCLHNEHTGEPVTAEDVRRFLVDHNIGIECSGFVTQVLRQEYLATKGFDFTRKIYSASPAKIFRWLTTKLRPIENISVKTYADNKNTTKIFDSAKHNYNDIKPGDLIVMLETGPNNKRNHIILITDKNNQTINYVHARAWGSEGKYGHGVTAGKIIITAPEKNLLEQEWTEKNYTGETNETYLEAKQARVLEIRRVKI